MGHGRQALRRKRDKLFAENPHCHWCGTLTALPAEVERAVKELRAKMATIDHLRARHHPGRTEPPKNNEVRLVLACWTCNNERDKADTAAHWTVEDLWERSGAYPRGHLSAHKNGRRPTMTDHEHRCALYSGHIGLCRCDCGAVEISYQNGRPHWHVPSRRGCSEREAPTIINNGNGHMLGEREVSDG